MLLLRLQVDIMHNAKPRTALCKESHVLKCWLVLILFALGANSNAADDGKQLHNDGLVTLCCLQSHLLCSCDMCALQAD